MRELPRYIRMLENGLQLGAEVQVAVMSCIIQRLDTKAISDKNQPVFAFLPNSNGEHAAQALETRGIPLHKGPQGHFRIAMGFEVVTERFEFAAQLRVIIDFTVEGDCVVSVFGVHRLIAAGKIDNLQPDRSEGNVEGFVDALLVRASMVQTLNS